MENERRERRERRREEGKQEGIVREAKMEREKILNIDRKA